MVSSFAGKCVICSTKRTWGKRFGGLPLTTVISDLWPCLFSLAVYRSIRLFRQIRRCLYRLGSSGPIPLGASFKVAPRCHRPPRRTTWSDQVDEGLKRITVCMARGPPCRDRHSITHDSSCVKSPRVLGDGRR